MITIRTMPIISNIVNIIKLNSAIIIINKRSYNYMIALIIKVLHIMFLTKNTNVAKRFTLVFGFYTIKD